MSQVKVIGHATTFVKAGSFVAYAMAMGKRFRGFATIESEVTISNSKIRGGKSSGYAGRITKYSKTQVYVNPHYANHVNNQRAREHGDHPIEGLEHFESAPRSWGTRIEGTSFVEHKGNYYLEVAVQRCLETQYFIDGQPVAKDTAEALLHPPRESKRQKTAKAIILRDYRADSLRGVTWTCPESGVKYELTIE